MKKFERRVRVASACAGLALCVCLLGWHESSKRASAKTLAPTASARPKAAARFPCGELQCDPDTSYCETINTDVPELPSNYACRPLPSACLPRADGAPRDCQCFPPRTRGNYCSAPATNGVRGFYRTSIGGH